ncbi:MAG: hypothetical protein Q7R95_07925 [bacterium]|nr:hypothetical protein [bacterium]
MKVFFTASKEGQQYFDFYYQQILSFLDKENYENSNKDYFNNINKSRNLDVKDQNILFKLLIDKIHKSDICIFECSFNSITVGFLIEKALEIDKPVIALHLENHTPEFLSGIDNDKFQLIEYTKTNLTKIMPNAIIKASLHADKRFNFFVSSNMLIYLNKISRSLGITKSTFIRNLIEEYRKNHP